MRSHACRPSLRQSLMLCEKERTNIMDQNNNFFVILFQARKEASASFFCLVRITGLAPLAARPRRRSRSSYAFLRKAALSLDGSSPPKNTASFLGNPIFCTPGCSVCGRLYCNQRIRPQTDCSRNRLHPQVLLCIRQLPSKGERFFTFPICLVRITGLEPARLPIGS